MRLMFPFIDKGVSIHICALGVTYYILGLSYGLAVQKFQHHAVESQAERILQEDKCRLPYIQIKRNKLPVVEWKHNITDKYMTTR